MNESLKQWLDPTRKPRSHYELLGQPLFQPNLDTLKAALRERMRELLPYQSHANKQTAQQACELMTQLGAASRVFNNATDLSEYLLRLRVEIRDELRAVQAREGSEWSAEQIAGWLMFRKDIHPEAVAETMQFLQQAAEGAVSPTALFATSAETMQFLQQAADADQAITPSMKTAPNSHSSLPNPLPSPPTALFATSAETMQFLQQAADADQAVTPSMKTAPNSHRQLSPPQTAPRQSRAFGAAGSNSLPVPPPMPARSPISSDEVEFVIVPSATPPAPSTSVMPLFPANESAAALESRSTRQLHEMFELADAEAHALTPSSKVSRSHRGPVSSLPVQQKWIFAGCALVLLGLASVWAVVSSRPSRSDSNEATGRNDLKNPTSNSAAGSVAFSDQKTPLDYEPSPETSLKSNSTKPDNQTTEEQPSTTTPRSAPVSPPASRDSQTAPAPPSPAIKPAPRKSNKGTESPKLKARPPMAPETTTPPAQPVPTPPPKPKAKAKPKPPTGTPKTPSASTPKTQTPVDPKTELLNRLKGDYDLQEVWIRTDHQRGANELSDRARLDRRDQFLLLTVGAGTRVVPTQRTYLLALQGQMLTLRLDKSADNSGPVNFTSFALRVSPDGSELTGMGKYTAVGQGAGSDPQGRGITAITLSKRSSNAGVIPPNLSQRSALIQLEDPDFLVNDAARTEALTCLSDWFTRSGFQVSNLGSAKDFDYVVKLRVEATKFDQRNSGTYQNALGVTGTVVAGEVRLIATCVVYKGRATQPLFKLPEVGYKTESRPLPSPINIADIRPFGRFGHVFLTSDLKTIPSFLAQIAVKQFVVQPPFKKSAASATLMEFLATEETKK